VEALMADEQVQHCKGDGCGSPLAMHPEAKGGLCGDCIAEGACPSRKDGIHCVHWWDGEDDAGNFVPCCACGFNGGQVHAAGCKCVDCDKTAEVGRG
jgi:hypothetical protein